MYACIHSDIELGVKGTYRFWDMKSELGRFSQHVCMYVCVCMHGMDACMHTNIHAYIPASIRLGII